MVNYSSNDFEINKLGSFYFTDKTIFRVFAPESKSVNLVINEHRYVMHQNGLCFEIGLAGDLELVKYYYENDLGVTYRDPFAYYSDDKYSYVLNRAKFNNIGVELSELKDIVIYETSVRDFSCDASVDFKHPRKLLALSETNLKKDDYYMMGIDYVKNLGVSHVQLMPILDFDLDNSDYNWGYNPLAYNYINKDYIEDKDNPYAYINEFKKVVNTLHDNEIRVTLDVVFNHVYRYENFDLDKMLGGHAFRKMDDGSLAKGSLCGNEIASEDPFVRAYLIEMSRRYVELFDIDGLRIDLMGILDYQTVNMLNEEMKAIKNDFIIYGEGWNMGDKLDESLRASINNHDKMKDIYMFDDEFRENIINYICGNTENREIVKACIGGHSKYLDETQSVNYIECHDGYTFFDRLMKFKGEDSLENNIRKAKLGLGLVMISKGIPFIHSGQEFLRTKQLVENSYNSNEDINKLDWNRRIEYNNICDYLKGLIEIRREYRLNTVDYEFDDYYECLIYKVGDLMIIINPCMWDHIYQDGNDYEVIYDVDGKNCYTSSILAIPAYSLLICKR